MKSSKVSKLAQARSITLLPLLYDPAQPHLFILNCLWAAWPIWLFAHKVKNPPIYNRVKIFTLKKSDAHLPTPTLISLFLLLLLRSWKEKDRRLLCCQNCKCKTTSLACYLAKVQIYCFWRRLWVQSVLNFFNFAPLYRLPGQPPSIFALVSDERVPIQILAAPILIGCWKALWKPTLRTRTSGLVRSKG